jgi:F-box-like
VGGPFEAEEGIAECSAVPPDERRQQNDTSHSRRVQRWLIDLCASVGKKKKKKKNVSQHTAIDRLPDEVLEEIFRFDRLDTISHSLLDGHRGRPWKWHRLVHVCRRWRYIIFNAPCSLKLQLFCTHGTPVKKNLDCWPPLPIVLQYVWSPNLNPPPVDEDDVIAALQHPDRIRTIQLPVTTSLLEKLTTVAQKQFPVLECLELVGEPDEEPILPIEFLVGPFPSLRILRVTRVAFPALEHFLPFAKNLVSLHLETLPAYPTLTALRNLFPGMTHLEELYLHFHSPISRLISESGGNNPANAPPCRAVLPGLKFVEFCGTSEDLECLSSSIEAPVLQDIKITFFNQATIFDTSQFVQFLSHTETQRSQDSAKLHCSESDISVAFFQQTRHQMTLRVRCMSLDWQLSCMAEICANLFPIVSDVRHLDIDASFPFPSEHDDMDPLPLLELFRPFSKVKRLFLSEAVALYVKYALKQDVAMEVLPNAREMEVIAPETGRPAHARYSFDGRGEGELELAVGQEIEILDDNDHS